MMRLEDDALYTGEIVAIVPFSKAQVLESLASMVLMGLIIKQTGFKKNRYFVV